MEFMNNQFKSFINQKGIRVCLTTLLFLGIVSLSYYLVTVLTIDNKNRLYNNRYLTVMKDEGFSVLKSGRSLLGKKNNTEIPDRKEIGPLPEGKFISSYIKETEETIDVFKKTTSGFWIGTKKLKYITNLSIYDITDSISKYENEEVAYLKIKENFKSLLSMHKTVEFNPLKYKNKSFHRHKDYYIGRQPGLSYVIDTHDGKKISRSIYFANKKVYVIEVRSDPEGLYGFNLLKNIIRNITTKDIDSFNKEVKIKIILLPLIIIFMSILFTLLIINKYIKKSVKNCKAYSLFKWALSMTILNGLCLLYIIISSHMNNVDSVMCRAIISTLFIMDLLLCPYLYIKSKEDYMLDFLIPNKFNSYFDKRMKDIQERKTLLLLAIYPLFILGTMPFGIYILGYIIPLSIILIISLEIRNIYRWIYNDSSDDELNNQKFIDYYVILDVKKESSKSEIESAFNSAVSKYNSANGNPLYGKPYYNKIQEAYAVLSSRNQLKPEYDIEYEKYKSSQTGNYEFENKQLENEIELIRNSLSEHKSIRWNIVIVSLLIMLACSYSCLRIANVIPPLWKSNTTKTTHPVI